MSDQIPEVGAGEAVATGHHQDRARLTQLRDLVHEVEGLGEAELTRRGMMHR